MVPTFAEYVPHVAEWMPAPSQRVYGPYWKRIIEAWGARILIEPTIAEVLALMEQARSTALMRRTSNGGKRAALHTYDALGSVYRFAVQDGILTARENPMTRISQPPKGKSRRHALTPTLYGQIWTTAGTTGNDPALDALLLRFHLETGARTGGALALRRT